MVVNQRYEVRYTALDGARKAIYVKGGRSVRDLRDSNEFCKPTPPSHGAQTLPNKHV